MRAPRRALAGAAAVIPATFALAAPAAAEPVPAPAAPNRSTIDYCATDLLTPEQLAAGVRSTIRCFDSFDTSLRSIAVEPATVGSARSASTQGAATLAASGLVAVHYDGANGRGTYLSIGGSTCEGGGISFAAGDPWNDRIRSTAPRGCSTIKHWDGANYGGEVEVTNGAGSTAPVNLNGLGGRVGSIRYYNAVAGG